MTSMETKLARDARAAIDEHGVDQKAPDVSRPPPGFDCLARVAPLHSKRRAAAERRINVSRETVVAFIGVPYDGAATLGWPGARYAPEEVRRQLAWMRMRVEDGRIYWVD
jgi:hypothetical protein